MGYLFTPTQREKDTNFINSTLEDLKTTNLLKNAQNGANNASLNAQNTNIPQTTISQTQANNAKENIGFSTNMLNQNKATNTTTNTQISPEIAMSSDKNFKPQDSMAQIPLQTQAKPKSTLLQRERDNINFNKQFDSSVYSRNNVEFLGKPREFANHKLAMEAKSRLYDNYADDINENELAELTKRHRLLDKAVDALESAKDTFGENSKEYKRILDDYMQYGILKDNNIKDYASLANFYNSGGNVGLNPATKASENVSNDNVNTTNSNNTGFSGIDDFIYRQKKFINDEMRNSDESNLKHVAKRAMGAYDTGSQLNSSKQNKQGLNASNAISLIADRNMLDNATKSGLEKVNNAQDTSYRDMANATQKEYDEAVADIIEGGYANKRLNTMSKDWEDNKGFFTHVGNALMLPLDASADMLKSATTMVAHGMSGNIFNDKANAVLNETKLADKSGASMQVFGSGANNDDLLQMSNYLDEALKADKKTSLLWDTEAKPKLVKYLKAQGQDKDKAWQEYQNAMQKVQTQWDKAPSKLLASSELIGLAETMRNQHDYGRFVLNLFKNPNENKELAQSYLTDLQTILKQNDKFKDVSEVVLTKSGQVAVKRGDNYETLEQGFLDSILHGIYDSVNEIGLSIGGAMLGGAKGASKAKSAQGKVAGAIIGGVIGGAIGAGLGAITDEQINSWTTNYKNPDGGLKRGLEAGILNLGADIALIGGGYAIKQGAKGLKSVADFSISDSVSGIKDKASMLANGNVNAVTNFLAKNALEQSERELITKEAQARFLNGKSLQEFRSDTSIPRLDRLKTAWQYEKFINKESMEKGKLKLESLSKEFEKFQTTSMESNRPIMDIFQDMFEGKATRNEREKFLRFVSQNEGLKSALSSVIAKNPTLALNFGKFIDKRASNVAKSIESEALTQNMFKGMDSNYAKELKNRYGKVEFDIVKTLNDVDFSEIGNKIDNILSRLEESIPHIVNANQTITAMRKKLEARSEVGLNASDLLDIRKYYNDILRSKDFKNASYKHLQAINKEIDLAIEAGLEDIASKSGIKTDRLLRNYRDINKEYADYARFKDSDFYKDTIKNKTREKDLSDESFNKAILKQAQREEGFNNKVFNRIANNTDKNLQAQAIKELIQRNIANGNGQFKAVKWQELIDDLAKIEHSITDEGLRGLVANLKSAKGLYHADNEFLQAVQRSIGSKPANVLISAASGFFNRTLLLFYNFLHKIMARYAGALSENLAHASLEHQLNLALRYARDTKDFINVSIDSISKNIPLDDREANRVLKELEYWKNQFNKDEISSFYNIKEAQQTEQQIQAHKEVLQEKKEVLDRQIESINAEVQEITQSILKDSNETAKAMPSKRLYTSIEEMEEIERKIENGEIEVEVRQKDLEKLLNSYTMDLKALLAKKDEIEKELEHYKGLSDIDLMEQKSYYVSSSKRALSAIKRDIENTKESINELKAEIQNYGHELIKSDSTNSKTISKALASLNTSDSVSNSKALISASKVYAKSLVPYNKPSMTTNLLTYNTKALPNPNTTNKALVSTNLLNDTKALTYNPSTANNLIKFNQDLERLHELEKYVYKLQTLENHFKDFMSMPFSVIVDSKGNAMPLTIEALKNFIFQNLYKEWLNTRKALNMPILELDFKPLMNKVKALQYKASSETKAHLRIINDKTNSFLDSLQELKAQAKEIKLLPYNKPKENGAINEAINKVNGVGSVVDRPMQFNSVLAENMQKDMLHKDTKEAFKDLDTKSMDKEVESKEATQATKQNTAEILNNDLKNLYDSWWEKTNLSHDISGKEKELEKLKELKEKKEAWLERLQGEASTRTLTKIIKNIPFKDFSKHRLLDYDDVRRLKKVNPRLSGEEFFEEAIRIDFKDLKKFIKSKDDFIEFANKIHTFYYDRGDGSYVWFKDLPYSKQNKLIEAFRDGVNNYDKYTKEVLAKAQKDVSDFEALEKLEKELPRMREQEAQMTKEIKGLEERIRNEYPYLIELMDSNSIGEFMLLRTKYRGLSEKDIIKKLYDNEPEYLADSRHYIEKYLNIKPLAEFGTNYAEFFRDGMGAVEKLMQEKQGQVAGAFYREGIGDITLVWGEKGSGKSDGWGLAKIAEYHPEVLDKLDDLVQTLPIVKESDNRIKLDNGDFFLSIRKDFEGQKENWILTAFERDESIARRRTNLPSSQGEAEKTTSANAKTDSTTNPQTTQTESKTTREIIKEAKDKGLSVKETKELVAKNKQKTKLDNAINTDKDKQKPQENDLIDEANKAYKNEPQSDKEIDNIKSTSNPAGILNPEETATLNKEFRLKELEDLKGEKALYNANIQSLELLDNILKSGRIASDDEKQILSNFRGFGKASVELSKIIKEDGKRLEKLNNLLESLSKHLNKEVKATDLYLRANDAYYTPTPIIESMVKLAKDLGLKEDHYILEPSCGSGRFLGQFNSNQKVAGIELDPLTAKLAKTIYPYYRIDNAGFEKSKYAINNAYDLVIGNPPYGNFTIRDDSISASAHNYFMQKGIDMLSEGGISIQIVTKSFMDSDNLATKIAIAEQAKFLGGVRLPNNAFKDASVTTDILVFKKDSNAKYADDKSWVETSELNGIPVSKYFLDNPQNILGEMKVGKGQFGDIVHVINKEGIDFNELPLAKYLTYRDEGIDNIPEKNKANAIDLDAMAKPSNDKNYDSATQGRVSFNSDSGEFIKDNEALDIRTLLKDLEVRWTDSTIEKRIEDYKQQAPKINKLQNTLYELQQAELYDDVDNLATLRRKLNHEYDELLGKNGSFHTKNGNIAPKFKLFEMLDDTSFEIFALEKAPIIKNNKVIGSEKSDIFTKRITYPYNPPLSADNLNEAMSITLNEYVRPEYTRIAELLGKDVDSVKKELLDTKAEYLDHNGERLQKDIFLSGDVKTRLEAFHDEYGMPKFSDDEAIAHYQKIAYNDLKAVIPDDIELPLIEIPLGANWLDKDITDSFLRDIVGMQYLDTAYTHGIGWRVSCEGVDRDFLIATGKDFRNETGIEYINGAKYIEDMLNQKTLEVKKVIEKGGNDKIVRDPVSTQALEKLKKQLKTEFKQYIIDNDSYATTAQKQYNDTFNREVLRQYDGSHIQLVGANSNIDLRPHQKNAVYRGLQERSVLLAHEVGTGKSYTMIALGIEGKRMGVHNKPMIVVPNHIAPQLATEARKLYPNAKIKLVQAVSRKNKNKKLASIKNNQFDLIISTLTAYTNMNVSPQLFKEYMDKEIAHLLKIQDELLASKKADHRKLKSIAGKIANTKIKIQEYIDSAANDKQNIFFDSLGVDTIMFDEAHYLKNLPILTAQYNVRGIGSADSQRAIDAYMKINGLRDNPNSKVIFATGTPITNFISDIYTMQKFMDFEALKNKGIDVFDEWCKQFADPASEFEMKATGEYKITSRLREFKNLPELKKMYYKFADLVTKEDMQNEILKNGGKLVEPKIKRVNVVIPRNKEQIDFMEEIKQRAKEIERDPKSAMEKGGDNMLKIISDSNKASIDMRLIKPNLKRDENGKIAQCASNILETYKEFDKYKGAQLVFLDSSVPKKPVKPETLEKWKKDLNLLDRELGRTRPNQAGYKKLFDKQRDLERKIEMASCNFSAYDDLKELLIEKGIKENEIAFVHDYDNKKDLLSDKINKGEIRVLIGSTSKMGAGCNFQERLAALHHLDLDWTPANMEQREGRIIRQGNILMDLIPNFEARIYTYVTEQMSDNLLLQTLEQKSKIIKQIQNPNILARKIEDTSEDNLHGRLKAMSSPNAEQELEAMSLVKTIDELENAIATHDVILKSNMAKIDNSKKSEEYYQKQIDMLDKILDSTKDNTIISFDKEKIDFEKKLESNKKEKDSKDKATKQKEKTPRDIANEKLNKIMQDFAKSANNVEIICGYRGANIIARKDHAEYIELYLGKDLKDSVRLIANPLDLKDVAYSEKDYMQTFNRGYSRISNDESRKIMQSQMQKAKDIKEKATKAFDKESANKETIAKLRDELQDKLVRQAELHYFLGRADNNEKQRLEAVYGKDSFASIVYGKFDKGKDVVGKDFKPPIKSQLDKDLSTEEIRQVVDTWDLNNPKKSDKLIVSKVDEDEKELLARDFNFKGNYAIAREIDSEHLAHALNRHGNDSNVANIPITKDEILEFYPQITKEYDNRVVTKNNTIIYSKQINGHFVVVEEVLTGRNKLRFNTAWKQKGQLNKEVLFKNAKVFPNAK